MAGIYGYNWTKQYGEKPDVSGVWIRALSGLSHKQIWDGIEKLIHGGGDWPPGAAKFREICLGGSDSPSVDSAYFELAQYLARSPSKRNARDLSPAVLYTIRKMDFWSFQQLNGDKQLQIFKSAYTATLAAVKSGLKLEPDPEVEALPFDPPGPPASRETAERGINTLKSLFEE